MAELAASLLGLVVRVLRNRTLERAESQILEAHKAGHGQGWLAGYQQAWHDRAHHQASDGPATAPDR